MDKYEIAVLILTVLGCVWGIATKATKTVTPLLTNISELNTTMRILTDELREFKEDNKQNHQELWKHDDKQDKILNDHEKRISVLESREKGD